MPSSGRTLDEFAVPEAAQEMMTVHRPRIEQLFRVELNVLGVLELAPSPSGESQGERKIWLQLQGCRENLQRAKEYIKGLCAPELNEEVWYPKDMQCVFLGAQGLFLNCLTQGTSADLTLLRPGSILVSGLAEAFVMAQSRIQDFVEKYKKNPKLEEEREAQVKRAFQELVEAYDDKYAMDLLILPTAVKEELLSLVKEIQEEEGEQRNGCWSPPGFRQDRLPQWETGMGAGGLAESLEDHLEEGRDTVPAREPSPVSLPEESSEEELSSSSSDTLLSSGMEKEFKMRLNFFKTMGYEERLVKKVLLEGGVREAPSTILDRVQMEEAGLSRKDDPGLLRKEPGDIEHASPLPEKVQDKDEYLLEVIKTAVANCGHSPSKIPTGIQTGAPLADLLRQLNEKGGSQDEAEGAVGVSAAKVEHGGIRRAAILNHEESSQHKRHQETGRNRASPFHEDVRVPPVDAGVPAFSPDRPPNANPFFSTWDSEESHSAEGSSLGPPNPGSVSTVTGAQRFEEALRTQFKLKLANTPGEKNLRRVIIDGSNVAMMYTGVPQETNAVTEDSLTTTEEEAWPINGKLLTFLVDLFLVGIMRTNRLKPPTLGAENSHSSSQAGETRTPPFDSMHGLNQFFSCRGIALAVQHFWDRGHREVTVFVPAYRMEPDSSVREQHFLFELRELSILSVTPSRKVDGKTILPYDDRLMLKLAEETNGIIVTNDQFRDLAKESKKWIRIIKERVLQYTFVQNIFMVPDDPLGRGGPTLMEFLKKTPRSKPAKCHTFAGRATQVPVPVHPTSQTEVLRLRDRWPTSGSAGNRQRRLQEKRDEEEEEKAAVRSVAETDRLRRELLEIFVDQDKKIDFVLHRNPCSCDLNTLSEAVLSLGF
ncbi:UNVERIFIED_CONTAM: hypothetical protein K2H54_034707 [Gekko kuhli]